MGSHFVGRKFVLRKTQWALGYFLSRELSKHVDLNKRFGGVGEHSEFNAAMRFASTGQLRNIMLWLEDISKKAVTTVPAPLIDLLEIATYVYCADQAFDRFSGETMRVCSGFPLLEAEDVTRQVLDLQAPFQ